MFRPLLCFFLVFCAIGNARIPVAFLGVQSEEEPLLKADFEKKIQFELLDMERGQLVEPDKIKHYMNEGAMPFPIESAEKSREILQKLEAQMIVSGDLKRLKMSFTRTWWRPWKGSAHLNYDFDLVIRGEDDILYKGRLTARKTLNNVYLGNRPVLSKIDPMLRHFSMEEILTELAKEIEYKVQSVMVHFPVTSETSSSSNGIKPVMKFNFGALPKNADGIEEKDITPDAQEVGGDAFDKDAGFNDDFEEGDEGGAEEDFGDEEGDF